MLTTTNLIIIASGALVFASLCTANENDNYQSSEVGSFGNMGGLGGLANALERASNAAGLGSDGEGQSKSHDVGSSSAGSGSLKNRAEDKEEQLDFFKDPSEIIKLFLNPLELVKAITSKYKLHFGKFVEVVGKPLVFGIEAALTPFISTLEIIEKVFVPDTCRLHFVCMLASNISFLKEHASKFSPKFGENSSLMRAFGEGILGNDCRKKYACEAGEPKLKPKYESLKKD